MTKSLLLIALLVLVMLNTAAAGTNVRRRGGEKGVKKTNKRSITINNSVRKLQPKQKYYYYQEDPPQPPQPRYKSSKSSKSKKGGRNGGRRAPKCRPVVEGAEFIIEGSISSVMANMTEDREMIGTEFLYNGPLLEFNDDDELVALENFFLSGACTRTQEFDGEMPGAGHCSYTITLDTGATMNFGGEMFDGWDNLMAINGGSQELMGLSGSVTLIPLNENFEKTDEDIFSVPFMYGEAVLVYSICPQGYWDRYYIDDHDALPPPSIPNPFEREVIEEEVIVAVPADDDEAF